MFMIKLNLISAVCSVCAQKEQICIPLGTWSRSDVGNPLVHWAQCPAGRTPLSRRQWEGRLCLLMEVRHMDTSSMQHAESGFWAEGVYDSRTMTLNQQISKSEMLQLFLIPIVLFWEILTTQKMSQHLTAKSHYKSVIYIRNSRDVTKPFLRTQTQN